MKIILFGATGMVGQAVLRQCLVDDGVERVLAVGRKATGQSHVKLHELVRPDLFDTSAAAELSGYDACFFCLGVSSVGMNEADYTRLTYDLTLGWARALARNNPKLAFTYVSGAGTDGKAMWARVKKRTEDDLLALFAAAYMFRLSALRALHDEKPRARGARFAYAVLGPLLPLVRVVAPSAVVTSEELGRAMLAAARGKSSKRVLGPRDIQALGAA